MFYRQLGRTQLQVGVIGLGVEHLKKFSADDVTSIVGKAVESGINFIDMVWSLPNVVDGVASATAGRDIHFQIHLGSCVEGGAYMRSRDPKVCRGSFEETLRKLGREQAEIANIHYVKDKKTWIEVNKKGIVDLALELKQTGTAKSIGVSTHSPEVVKIAVEAGDVDVVTHQVNLASHGTIERDEALQICNDYGVGLVAMKPFAGGKLLKHGKTVKIASYQTGGKSIELKLPEEVTPVRCISYVLDQPGVSTAICGFSKSKEVDEVIRFFESNDDEKDYTALLKKL